MILSIDESIQKLKAEIISQDWSLAPRKIEPLAAAFACLKNRFSNRKNLLAMLTMADSVLQFARKRESSLPPEFIDFLKETMAHIVTIYEDSRFDPDREADLFKRVYAKFTRLREMIKAEQGSQVRAARPRPASPAAAPRRGPAGTAAGGQQSAGAAARVAPPRPASPEARFAAPPQGSLVRGILLGEMAVGVPEEDIALARPITAKQRARYIAENQVPLKDLAGLFKSLAGRMRGPLARMKDSRLKGLVLPLMVPRGMDLATIPDHEASSLLILSRGQWHGAVICRHLDPAPAPLLGFAETRNGDVAGRCSLESRDDLPLLNVEQMLKREGFFSLPL